MNNEILNAPYVTMTRTCAQTVLQMANTTTYQFEHVSLLFVVFTKFSKVA